MSRLQIKLSFSSAYIFFNYLQHLNIGRFLKKNLDFPCSFEMLEDLSYSQDYICTWEQSVSWN